MTAANIAPDLVQMSGDNTQIFDQMTANGVKIVLTSNVEIELGQKTVMQLKNFEKWLQANPVKVELLDRQELTNSADDDFSYSV